MTQNEFKGYTKEIFEGFGIELSDEKLTKFWIYRNMLLEWNTKINLTAITDDVGIAVKHFLDSALLLEYVNIPQNASVVDVGTGAGFPGVVLKIMREDIQLTLMDSLNKRLVFLDELLKELEIDGKTVHMRGEEAGRKTEYRDSFDIATARAVARMGVLCEYCLPLVKVGGYFAVMKGSEVEIELDEAKSAIKLLGGHVEAVHKYTISDDNKRAVIDIKKISQTSTKFPRPTAKIAKNPI